MTNRFEVNFFGPDNQTAKLFLNGPEEPGDFEVPRPFVRKLPNDAESADWVFVENSSDASMVSEGRKGWLRTWAIGRPLADLPQTLSAKSLTLAAIRAELDDAAPTDLSVAAEYFLALFALENQTDLATELAEDTVFKVNNPLPDPDLRGAFAVSTPKWRDFIAAEGDRLRWKSDALRELALPQLTAAAWLARRDMTDIGVKMGGTPAEPFITRMLDLFLAHLFGAPAAVALIQAERSGDGLQNNIKTLLRDTYSWTENAPEMATLFKNRAVYLGELDATAGTTGGMLKVRSVLDACRAALDPAVKFGRAMVDRYVPGFAVVPTGKAGAWLAEAEAQLGDWKTRDLVEQQEPGLSLARLYFEATDFGPDVVIDSAGELTHWCGAFVAHCVRTAGVAVPTGAAAAGSWLDWGDASLPVRQGADIPPGAVVTLSGDGATNGIGHVNFFVEWSPDGSHYRGLGGNQSDRVNIQEFPTASIARIRILADHSSASPTDQEVLAKTLYGEIRGALGAAASGIPGPVRNVADVILTRFLTGYRSHGSIAGTCRAPSQFSCWNPGTDARSTLDSLPANDPTLLRLLAIAKTVIADRLAHPDAPPPLQGARHYLKTGTSADWVIPANLVLEDGHHSFYRNIK